MSTSKASTYIPELDGLRGISILLVVLYHCGFSFFQGGFIGVDVFFVISGFLITAILIKEGAQTSSLRLGRFYIRRILRLFPAILLALFVFNVYQYFMVDTQEFRETGMESLYALFYFTNWIRAFDLAPSFLLGHTWSLSIEEQFYLLWPPLILLSLKLKNWRSKLLFLTITLIALSIFLRIYLLYTGAPAERIYNGTDTRMDGLLSGAVLALLHDRNAFAFLKKKFPAMVLMILSCLGILVLVLISFVTHWKDPMYYMYYAVLVNFFSLVIILQILQSSKNFFHRFLSFKPLVFTGKISYGLYLWHYLILVQLSKVYGDPLKNLWLGVPLSILVAVLSYYFYEKPFLKLKSRFA